MRQHRADAEQRVGFALGLDGADRDSGGRGAGGRFLADEQERDWPSNGVPPELISA
jgi:hypothetical protein